MLSWSFFSADESLPLPVFDVSVMSLSCGLNIDHVFSSLLLFHNDCLGAASLPKGMSLSLSALPPPVPPRPQCSWSLSRHCHSHLDVSITTSDVGVTVFVIVSSYSKHSLPTYYNNQSMFVCNYEFPFNSFSYCH